MKANKEKNECWYVVQAEPGAKLFMHDTTPWRICRENRQWSLSELLPKFLLKPATSSMFRCSTIHAIGGGIVFWDATKLWHDLPRLWLTSLTLEILVHLHIQQTKDVTTIRHSVPNQPTRWRLTMEQERLCGEQFFTAGDHGDAPLFYLSPWWC